MSPANASTNCLSGFPLKTCGNDIPWWKHLLTVPRWRGRRGWTGLPDSVDRLFKPLLSSFSYAGCLQTVATVCCKRNYWFHRLLIFPALFSCSFSTPLIPRQRGTVACHVSGGFFAVVCRKKGTDKRSLFKTYRDMVCPCHPTQLLNLTRMGNNPLSPP